MNDNQMLALAIVIFAAAWAGWSITKDYHLPVIIEVGIALVPPAIMVALAIRLWTRDLT